MKMNFTIAMLVLFSIVPQAWAQITIDGNFSDWNGVPAYVTNSTPNTTWGSDGTFTAGYYVAGNDSLYVRTDVAGTFQSLDYNHYYLIYIDADTSTSTGLTNGWWSMGADYRIAIINSTEYIQKFMGTTQSDDAWGWGGTLNGSKPIDAALKDSSCELAVAYSDLGVARGSAIYLQWRAESGSNVMPVINAPRTPVILGTASTLSVPILLSPATTQRADSLILAWRSVPSASGYWVQLSDTASFSRFTISDSTADTLLTVTKLEYLHRYYWRVEAYNSGGAGSFSNADSFTTIMSVPTQPKLVAPRVTSTGIPRRAKFAWNVVNLASKYRLQVAIDSTVYTSGDSVGLFLAKDLVFDTTLTTAKDTSIQLSSPLEANTKYFWHVAGLDTAGAGLFSTGSFSTGTGILAVDELGGIPTKFELFQNFPNPFNPTTVIQYDIPKSSQVMIRVYDVLGREVVTLVDERQAPGEYSVEFNASGFASGVYFFSMNAGTYTKIQKMMLIK